MNDKANDKSRNDSKSKQKWSLLSRRAQPHLQPRELCLCRESKVGLRRQLLQDEINTFRSRGEPILCHAPICLPSTLFTITCHPPTSTEANLTSLAPLEPNRDRPYGEKPRLPRRDCTLAWGWPACRAGAGALSSCIQACDLGGKGLDHHSGLGQRPVVFSWVGADSSSRG